MRRGQQYIRHCHSDSHPLLHSFHTCYTVDAKEVPAREWKFVRKPRLPAQLLGQFIDQPVQILVSLAHLINLLYRVQYGCVVLAAKLTPNFREGGFCKMLRQVHGDLSGIDDSARIILGLDLSQTESKLLSHCLLDRLDGDLSGLGINEIFKHLLGVRQGNIGADQGGVGVAIERPEDHEQSAAGRRDN